MASNFSHVDQAPAIEVFALIAAFNADTSPDKVNLSVGAYRTNEGKPLVLPVVKQTEANMAKDEKLNHEYLPVAGLLDYRNAAAKLLLGADSKAISENRVGCVQACGGTGALRVCANFLKTHMKFDTVYVSNPTWGNHKGIFKAVGFSQIKEYRYWDAASRGLDLKGMLEDLGNAPEGSVVILHAVAHNPTGVDPTHDQWKQISDLCKKKKIFVVMDCAYQGFTSGCVDTDAWSVRHFVDEGFEFFSAQSFSKNFGLYNERVGNVCFVTKDSAVVPKVLSQMELIVRTTWSNPPNHGGRIVSIVLNDAELNKQWKGQVKMMADRIIDMRKLLYKALNDIKCPGNWDHVISQKGMFSYTGLNVQQSENMVKKHHIYVMKSGRINMCGITTGNVDAVAKAMKAVLEETDCQTAQSNI